MSHHAPLIWLVVASPLLHLWPALVNNSISGIDRKLRWGWQWKMSIIVEMERGTSIKGWCQWQWNGWGWRGSKNKHRKIKYLCYIFCHYCLQLCRVSDLTRMPLVCLSRLLYCLLSSTTSASCHVTASHPAVPPPVHLLWCHRLLMCPSSSLGVVHA